MFADKESVIFVKLQFSCSRQICQIFYSSSIFPVRLVLTAFLFGEVFLLVKALSRKFDFIISGLQTSIYMWNEVRGRRGIKVDNKTKWAFLYTSSLDDNSLCGRYVWICLCLYVFSLKHFKNKIHFKQKRQETFCETQGHWVNTEVVLKPKA